MKKIVLFLMLFLLFSTISNSQSYALLISPKTIVGNGSTKNFTVNAHFDNIIKSIDGVSKVYYDLDYNGNQRIIVVSIILKNHKSKTLGFEIEDVNNISAMVSKGGGTVTHECDGNVGGIIGYCQCCEFTKNKSGEITGCSCCKAGGCAHHVTYTESKSVILPNNLGDFIKNTFLN